MDNLSIEKMMTTTSVSSYIYIQWMGTTHCQSENTSVKFKRVQAENNHTSGKCIISPPFSIFHCVIVRSFMHIPPYRKYPRSQKGPFCYPNTVTILEQKILLKHTQTHAHTHPRSMYIHTYIQYLGLVHTYIHMSFKIVFITNYKAIDGHPIIYDCLFFAVWISH